MTTDTQPLTAWEIELADSLLVDVDLSQDVPCDTVPCDEAAVWGIRFHQCGHTAAYCQADRDRLEEAVANECAAVVHFPCTVLNTSWTWGLL